VGSWSGGERQFFSPKMEPTWDALDVMAADCDALCEVLDPARGACDAVAPETTTVCWPPWCAGGSPGCQCGAAAERDVPCPVPRVRTIGLCRRQSKELQDLTRNEVIIGGWHDHFRDHHFRYLFGQSWRGLLLD
jgi:hypothetical protein